MSIETIDGVAQLAGQLRAEVGKFTVEGEPEPELFPIDPALEVGQKERLAKFMQASVEGIVFHKDGVIVDANPPICALTGFALEDMLGRRTIEFIAPDEVAKVTSVIVSGQETTYESVLIDKHGQRIPVEFIVRTMEHQQALYRAYRRDPALLPPQVTSRFAEEGEARAIADYIARIAQGARSNANGACKITAEVRTAEGEWCGAEE